MVELPNMKTYFEDFLENIRISKTQQDAIVSAHTTLRNRLNADETLKPLLVDDFLQGSYKRSTIIKPTEGEASDVDIVVVTNISEGDCTPAEALDKFKDFLEKHYAGKYERKGHSWGITLYDAKIDMVSTSAPTEAAKEQLAQSESSRSVSVEEASDAALLKRLYPSKDAGAIQRAWSSAEDWKAEPLRIPNREADKWEDTDPLSQINWTFSKNKRCNGHYVNVVKAIKWWWRAQHPERKYPKGYPLEHFVGDCCPDGIASVAEGVTLSLENMVQHESKPFLSDRGIPENDVFSRITDEDYEAFHEAVKDAASKAREAFDAETVVEAAEGWRSLFGDSFPKPPSDESKASFSRRAASASTLSTSRFA